MKKLCAFTLAEVLITLGIIGVVAAMTLPTLIYNYDKQVVVTRLQKFYSSMNQAIKMAELEYGDKSLWFANISSSADNTDALKKEWFEKYLAPHLNIIKTKQIDGITTYYLSDGSAFKTNGNNRDWIFFPGDPEKCIEFGKNNIDNYSGRCAWIFYMNSGSKGFETFAFNWDGSMDDLKTSREYGCNEKQGWRPYCSRWIQMNGWKIPDDYPVKVRYR